MRPRRSESERFDEKWTEDAAGCFIWTGKPVPGGYGQFTIANGSRGGHKVYAHRWAYERANGPIPAGLEVDHLCNVPACVNPAHLEACTPRENNRRKNMRAGNFARRARGASAWSRGFTVSPGQGSAF